jgi:hypothetical protein
MESVRYPHRLPRQGFAAPLLSTILAMNKVLGHLLWAAVAVTAALTLGGVAMNRGESVNSMWPRES